MFFRSRKEVMITMDLIWDFYGKYFFDTFEAARNRATIDQLTTKIDLNQSSLISIFFFSFIIAAKPPKQKRNPKPKHQSTKHPPQKEKSNVSSSWCFNTGKDISSSTNVFDITKASFWYTIHISSCKYLWIRSLYDVRPMSSTASTCIVIRL